ncbi:MAG: ATP-binding protein [Bacteroidota bacterium]
MGTVHIVFGPQGAGKTTYSRRLAAELHAVHFSIDEWMHRLYGPDLPKPLNFAWIMERVGRCEKLIWATASEFAQTGGSVVLDLGFMKVASRTEFSELARSCALPSQLHFVDAPHAVRKARVLARNVERGETFSFEVTPGMFDFMEREFQRPIDAELAVAIVSITA